MLQHHNPRGPVDQHMQVSTFLLCDLPHFQVHPHNGFDHHKHKEQEEQQRIDRPDIFHQPTPESQRQSVDHCQKTEHRVQH